jgi:hypothetical protein
MTLTGHGEFLPIRIKGSTSQLERPNPPRPISETDVLNRLRSRIGYGFNQSALAAEFGVSPSFMSLVLKGKKPPTKAMLKSIGVLKRFQYFEAK